MKILGGRADHRWPTDINVLDQLLEVHALLGSRFLERVKIYDHHIDRLDSVLGDSSTMGRIFAAMQDSAVDFGMQRLYATVEHFGKTRKVGDVLDVDPRIAQQLRGSSCRNQLHAHTRQLVGEIGDAGFIGNTENCALDFAGHGASLEQWNYKFYRRTRACVEWLLLGFEASIASRRNVIRWFERDDRRFQQR